MLPMKMRSTRVASAALLRSAGRNRLGKDNTHCRIGTRGITESTRCAAVAAMCFVVQDGQTPRPLQEKATRNSAVQSGQRARAKPCARMLFVAFTCIAGETCTGAILRAYFKIDYWGC